MITLRRVPAKQTIRGCVRKDTKYSTKGRSPGEFILERGGLGATTVRRRKGLGGRQEKNSHSKWVKALDPYERTVHSVTLGSRVSSRGQKREKVRKGRSRPTWTSPSGGTGALR